MTTTKAHTAGRYRLNVYVGVNLTSYRFTSRAAADKAYTRAKKDKDCIAVDLHDTWSRGALLRAYDRAATEARHG
jgi:hypothetical protein